MAKTINIEGQVYPIKFGYGAFRIMGRKWGCKGINETMSRLSALDAMDENLTFEQEDIIADMILAGVELANPDIELPSQDNVMDGILQNPEILANIVKDLMASLPQANPDLSKKKKPAKQLKK